MTGLFQVGDIIKQRHQTGASNCIVIAFTSNPDVVIVHDPKGGYKKVFTWSHDLVSRASEDTLKEAQERAASGEIERSPWFQND